MQWKTEEEHIFKVKYAENYSSTGGGKLLSIIKSRKSDLDRWFKQGEITEELYNKTNEYLDERKRWAAEVDKEIQLAMKEASKDQPTEEVTLKEVLKDYAPSKVKDRIVDIRDLKEDS